MSTVLKSISHEKIVKAGVISEQNSGSFIDQ